MNIQVEKSFDDSDNSFESYYYGVFGKTEECTLKNIIIENINVDIKADFSYNNTSAITVGGLVSSFKGLMEKCYAVSGTIDIYMNGMIPRSLVVGGLIGGGAGNIRYCSNNIDIKLNSKDAIHNYPIATIGGVAGHLYADAALNHSVSHLINYAPIEVDSNYLLRCGGIVGSIELDKELSFCVNYGDLTLRADTRGRRMLNNGDHAEIGGIVGWGLKGSVENCINYGNIDGIIVSTLFLGYSNTGGIIGNGEVHKNGPTIIYDKTVRNCYNLATSLKVTDQALSLDPPKTENGKVNRITVNTTAYQCEEVYSIETLVNDQTTNVDIDKNEKNGQTLSEEEMNKKIQYILDELNLDQTA